MLGLLHLISSGAGAFLAVRIWLVTYSKKNNKSRYQQNIGITRI